MAHNRGSSVPMNPTPSPQPEEEPEEVDPEDEEEEEEEVNEQGEQGVGGEGGEEGPDAQEEDGVEKDESGEGEGDEWAEPDDMQSPSEDSKPTKKRRPAVKKGDGKGSRRRKKARSNKKDKSSAGPSTWGTRRVWRDEDEITLLQELSNYKKKNGDLGPNDIDEFYKSVKGCFSTDISRGQLYDKIRRLKNKFFAIKEKIEPGEQPVFSKPRDDIVFNISRRIWGDVEDTEEEENQRTDDFEADNGDFLSKYPNLRESFYEDSSKIILSNGVMSLLEDRWKSIGSAKGEELEKKWEEVRELETTAFVKKMDLILEQTKLLLSSSKKKH